MAHAQVVGAQGIVNHQHRGVGGHQVYQVSRQGQFNGGTGRLHPRRDRGTGFVPQVQYQGVFAGRQQFHRHSVPVNQRANCLDGPHTLGVVAVYAQGIGLQRQDMATDGGHAALLLQLSHLRQHVLGVVHGTGFAP